MTHLVRPLHKPPAVTDLFQATALLQAAHQYLVKRGIAALEELTHDGDLAIWGRRMKRVAVLLDGERPLLVAAAGRHNLGEVINQCATLERLLDALAWTQSQPDLRELRVHRCHPTTSSDPDPDDNDLVLADAAGRIRARFEVSDVSGRADSNGKERKDVISLGVLRGNTEVLGERPAGCRRFLVVSADFADHIQHRRRKTPLPFAYRRVYTTGSAGSAGAATVILELTPAHG